MQRNEARNCIGREHGVASAPQIEVGMVHRAETGSVSLEALLELVLVMVIVPPVLCCAMQALLALVGIVMPWLALVAIAAIAVGALAAAAAAARLHTPLPLDAGRNELPPPPPVRRPAGDRGFRH